MIRAFHIIISLLVAVPLGAGGLCCCLLGQTDAAAAATPAEPTHPCCPSDPAPPDRGQSSPIDTDESDCDCPVREAALTAGSSGGTLLPGPAPDSDGIALQIEYAVVYSTGERAPRPHIPDPPPKRPLYRTLSVLLC